MSFDGLRGIGVTTPVSGKRTGPPGVGQEGKKAKLSNGSSVSAEPVAGAPTSGEEGFFRMAHHRDLFSKFLQEMVREYPGMNKVFPFINRRMRDITRSINWRPIILANASCFREFDYYFKKDVRAGHLREEPPSELESQKESNESWLQLLWQATQKGSLPLLNWAREQRGLWNQTIYYQYACDPNEYEGGYAIPIKNYLLLSAARFGQLQVMQWAQNHGASLNILESLVQEGHVMDCSCKGCALDNKQSIELDDLCSFAAWGGHLEILKWCRENGASWNGFTLWRAAKRGDLAMVKWAVEHKAPWPEFLELTATVAEAAALEGHLHILEWLEENEYPIELDHVYNTACRYGQLSLLKWAHGILPLWNSDHASIAAGCGQLETLQWAHENQLPLDAQTCASAASNGKLHVLQWLREKEVPWDDQVCVDAATNGHLEVLKWARANGAPWHKKTFHFSYEESPTRRKALLSILWASENGALWSLGSPHKWLKDIKLDANES